MFSHVYQRNPLEPFLIQVVTTDKTDSNLKLPAVVQVSFAVSGRPIYLSWVFWWYFWYVTFCSHKHLPMPSLSSQFQMHINTSYLLKQHAQLPHTTKTHPCSIKTVLLQQLLLPTTLRMKKITSIFSQTYPLLTLLFRAK